MAIQLLKHLNPFSQAGSAETKPARGTRAPVRAGGAFTRDTLVTTRRAPAGPSAEELLRHDPAIAWGAVSPRVAKALAAYRQGALGASVRRLDLSGKTAQAVRAELAGRGFRPEPGVLKDAGSGKPVLDPVTGKPVPMEVWAHPDGGMVRIKPEGDPTSAHRPEPHLSVAVLYPPGASGHDFANEAFKVDAEGTPLPKWANDARTPVPADTPGGKQFLDALAARTHLNLHA